MTALNTLPAHQIAQMIRTGETTPSAVMAAHLERIAAREMVVGAFPQRPTRLQTSALEWVMPSYGCLTMSTILPSINGRNLRIQVSSKMVFTTSANSSPRRTRPRAQCASIKPGSENLSVIEGRLGSMGKWKLPAKSPL